MFLVDTNIFSEVTKPYPNPKIGDWLRQNQADIFISVFTIAEIQAGIWRLSGGKKRDYLQEELDQIRSLYRDVILTFDDSVGIAWASLDAELTRKGRRIPLQDSYIAATAIYHGLTLATGNEKDFLATGVKIFNPWK